VCGKTHIHTWVVPALITLNFDTNAIHAQACMYSYKVYVCGKTHIQLWVVPAIITLNFDPNAIHAQACIFTHKVYVCGKTHIQLWVAFLSRFRFESTLHTVLYTQACIFSDKDTHRHASSLTRIHTGMHLL
jgi:hypothetical protein